MTVIIVASAIIVAWAFVHGGDDRW